MVLRTPVNIVINFQKTSKLIEIPLPTPTRRPTGPLKLSIHPGIGSSHVDITAKYKIKNYKMTESD